MAGIDNSLNLGVGLISFDDTLGEYYQDISPAVVHITTGVFAALDENNIPYCIHGERKVYAPITIIQWALMNYDLLTRVLENHKQIEYFNIAVNWLKDNLTGFNDAIALRNKEDIQYSLPKGWISGMVQGQLISVFLRAYQFYNDEEYLKLSEKVFDSFKYGIDEGGFMRRDKHNCIWFEEYPTKQPSFVLNGFIYTMLGILDLYRVTKREDVKELWDECVNTLEVNLHKYDVWYWSAYDQLKKQLVSYYYQKNVHIPLMKIMFALTDKPIFDKYAKKWERNLNNPVHRTITKIMYRVQPRMRKLKKVLGLQKVN
jgi:heparosan-N-sulfate-glucuronate 5-epimerase